MVWNERKYTSPWFDYTLTTIMTHVYIRKFWGVTRSRALDCLNTLNIIVTRKLAFLGRFVVMSLTMRAYAGAFRELGKLLATRSMILMAIIGTESLISMNFSIVVTGTMKWGEYDIKVFC